MFRLYTVPFISTPAEWLQSLKSLLLLLLLLFMRPGASLIHILILMAQFYETDRFYKQKKKKKKKQFHWRWKYWLWFFFFFFFFPQTIVASLSFLLFYYKNINKCSLFLRFNPFYTGDPKRILANSADPDKTPQNAASDQGLHFLQIVCHFSLGISK